MTTNMILVIADLLRRAFPDPAVQIAATAVEATVRVLTSLSREHGIALPHGIDLDGDGVPDLSGLASTPPDHRVMDYWLAHALHTRTSPILSQFIGQLPMVRVVVEDGWSERPIETQIGAVHAGDHKLYSFTEIEKYLGEVSEAMSIALPPLSHVELLTPARAGGTRFGAIATYVFYGPSAHEPFAYALEAGMATGEPRVTYFAPSFSRRIQRKSHYHPTPFSSPDSTYDGLFLLTALHEPMSLDVKVLSPGVAEPHISIAIAYERVVEPDCVFPATLTFQAACRVAAIAEAAGIPFTDVGPLAPLFAAIGRDQFAWSKKPEKNS